MDLKLPITSSIVHDKIATDNSRFLQWPKPGQASIWADLNDIQIWLGSPRVRSKISPALLLWLLAVCTSLERALRLTRFRPWWHAPRFLLLAQDMQLDNIANLTSVMEQFVWAKDPIGHHVEYVLEQRDFIFGETNCRPDHVLSQARREREKHFIWDAPLSNTVEDRIVVVQWTQPEPVVQ